MTGAVNGEARRDVSRGLCPDRIRCIWTTVPV